MVKRTKHSSQPPPEPSVLVREAEALVDAGLATKTTVPIEPVAVDLSKVLEKNGLINPCTTCGNPVVSGQTCAVDGTVAPS